MHIQFQPITPQHSHFEPMSRLYQASFPPDERRPVSQLRQIAQSESRFSILGIAIPQAEAHGSPQFAGFIAYWHFGTFVYVEHLATQPQLRSQGLGKTLVQQLQSMFRGLPIVLEVEPAVDHVTTRRIAFYQRLGFRLHTRFRYMQPAYSPATQPLPLRLMTCHLTPRCHITLRQMAQTIAREVYQNYY